MSPTQPPPLKILGAPGSPYSRKLRAVLRFRRIPQLWIQRGSRDEGEVPEIPVQLMPVRVFPGPEGRYDQAAIDSTPLIRRLERKCLKALRAERAGLASDERRAVDALLADTGCEALFA